MPTRRCANGDWHHPDTHRNLGGDPAHSYGFAVRHLGISTVRGEFKEFEGTLEIGEEVSTSMAYGTVRVASVDTRESDRDDHLRSPEFFDAAQFPEILFESTKIEALDDDELPDHRSADHPRRQPRDRAARRGRRHRAGPLGQRARRPRSHRPALTWRLRDEAPADARERQSGRRRQGHARARRIGHKRA
jgi:hypothetical protein